MAYAIHDPRSQQSDAVNKHNEEPTWNVGDPNLCISGVIKVTPAQSVETIAKIGLICHRNLLVRAEETRFSIACSI